MNQELKTRVITATFLIAGLVALLIVATQLDFPRGSILLGLVTLCLASACALEYVTFSKPAHIFSRLTTFFVIVSPVVCAAIISIYSLNPLAAFLSGFFLGLLILMWVSIVAARSSLDLFAKSFAIDGVGQLLIGGGGAALIGIAFLQRPVATLIFLIVVVAINDSAAYFVGSKIGGPKLAPAISPKKTISGSFGGLIAGILGAVIVGRIMNLGQPLELILVSCVMVFAAQSGDLLKSYLKRLYGVKDSGNILPGHGGILDRLDGILGAAPFCLIWIELFR